MKSIVIIFCVLFSTVFLTNAFARTTILLSKNALGEQLNGESVRPEMTSDGSNIVFESNATNVQGVVEAQLNILLINRQPEGDQISLISASPEGFGGDRGSNYPAISADGSCVSFSSYATNLSTQDSYYVVDAFMRNLLNGNMILQSIDAWGRPSSGDIYETEVSNDCRFVVFGSAGNYTADDNDLLVDIFVRDNFTNETKLVSVNEEGISANAHCYYPSISGNGRYVVFESTATNLLPGVTDGFMHIYLKDLITGSVELISQNSQGEAANGDTGGYGIPASMSFDGRYVAFMQWTSTNLGGIQGSIILRDRTLGTTSPILDDSNQLITGSGPYISDNARFIVFRSPNGVGIVDRDFSTVDYLNTTDSGSPPLSVYPHGTYSANFADEPKISENGRFLVFSSWATNLVQNDTNLKPDVFLIDRANDNDDDGFLNLENIVFDDCNDGDSAIHPGSTETPYNGIDENCNGMADDDDLDNDGYGIAADCNDNDALINPGALEIPYNGIDENCNGMTDDDDLDLDGYVNATDCNDNNPAIHPGATEIPYNGIDENCNGMADDDDLDRDGYGIANDCNDSDASINPGATEIPYNGIDENCNGMADDDDLDSDGHGIATDCNDSDPTMYTGAPEIKHDGIDQDCNGYDLTINITTVTYKANRSRLTVDATSSLGAAANLQLVGYGPMTYSGNKWTITVSPTSNPGTVTVSGPEGSESKTVTIQ